MRISTRSRLASKTARNDPEEFLTLLSAEVRLVTVSELDIPDIIAAMGGLGTASYALVDGAKAIFGGPSNHGFVHIKKVIWKLHPEGKNKSDGENPLSAAAILDTLYANWINGATLADQKAIAKSLVKLQLGNERSAYHLAKATGVSDTVLAAVARKIANGETLEQYESDVYSRFDFVLTAVLDTAYQRADQAYRNIVRLWSFVVSILLALAGASVVGLENTRDWIAALLIGTLATPLAPLTKDLTSALQASVKTMQLLRK